MNIEFYHLTVKHAQISSLISKQMVTVKAANQGPEELLVVLEDLSKRLQMWHDDLPLSFRSGPPFKSSNGASPVKHSHVTFTRFIYCGSLIAMHSIFCHPWSRVQLTASQSPAIIAQRKRSAEVVASAAREIIIATQGLGISAASPVW